MMCYLPTGFIIFSLKKLKFLEAGGSGAWYEDERPGAW